MTDEQADNVRGHGKSHGDQIFMKITVEFSPLATGGRTQMARSDFNKFLQDQISQHPDHEVALILQRHLEISSKSGLDTHAVIPVKIVRTLGACGLCKTNFGKNGYPDYSSPGNSECRPC